MTLLENIAKLLDFDPKNTEISLILLEFTSKFYTTWMKLNDRIIYVSEIINNKLYIKNDKDIVQSFQLNDEIGILQEIVLEPGLYKGKDFLAYIYRLPNRQWLKSASFGNNTGRFIINGNNLYPTPLEFLQSKYCGESAVFNNKVYLYYKEVGYIKEHYLLVKNENYFNEIKELWKKLYRVIMESDYQQEFLEEKQNRPPWQELRLNLNEF